MRDPSIAKALPLRWLWLALLGAALLAAAPAGAAECSDGVDNDGDWAVDWPADPDRADPGQDNEIGPEPA